MRRIWPTSRRAQTARSEMERRPMDSITGRKSRPKTVGAQHAAPLHLHRPAWLRCEAGERLADISIAQPLQRAVAQLPHALASHTQHSPNFLECVLSSTIQSEIQPQHFCIE